MAFQEGRTAKSSRKSHGSSRSSGHKRSTTYDFTANFPAVTEEQEDQEASAAAAAAAAAAASPRSRGSRKSGHDTNVDYSSKRTKTSSTKGGHKGRKHGG
ncbi:hypothetical protein DL770_000313 [Monosporascus sp. CRB-9-2]|nr:hypothetical protein DL770_000313 [Monosporascus sp. CRB-9-2]